jgi:hypothetical protein
MLSNNMEQQILDLIKAEVAHQTQLNLRNYLERISVLYDIPIDRLIKDTTGIETQFCRGILKSHKRCLKNPQENGYCKFHQKQAPVFQKPKPVEERAAAPWE